MSYAEQWDVFKVASNAGWPDKPPSVLGTWEADRKFWSACRYITEHDQAWDALPERHKKWVRRIADRSEP